MGASEAGGCSDARQGCFGLDNPALSARKAEHDFGRLIDTVRAEAVTVKTHGQPVVVVLAVEEYEKK